MNKIRTATATRCGLPTVLSATLLLMGCSGLITTPPGSIGDTRLAACTMKDSMFENLPFSEWPEKYHTTVAKVIDAHEDTLKDTKTQQLQCTAPDYPSIVKPTPELKKLAETLAPWKDPDDLKKLSEMDIGAVLLEYIRIYECSLNERRNALSVNILRDFQNNSSSSAPTMDRISFNETVDGQTRTIEHQLKISRLTLNRTMVIVGGEDRLRPLALDIECLKRVSLDIRNILGLVSQATACMPRIRDARGSLRDLSEPPAP